MHKNKKRKKNDIISQLKYIHCQQLYHSLTLLSPNRRGRELEWYEGGRGKNKKLRNTVTFIVQGHRLTKALNLIIKL